MSASNPDHSESSDRLLGDPVVSFKDAWQAFMRIGLLSFGGPTAQIAVMHKILVEEKAWLGETLFVHALSFCMLLPGPEAMQLATYAGWRLRGIGGGLLAGLLFVLPGSAVMLALIIVVCLTAISAIGTQTNNTFTRVANQMSGS